MLWTGPSSREDGKAKFYYTITRPALPKQLEEAGEGEEESILKAGGSQEEKAAASKIQLYQGTLDEPDKTSGITDPKTDVNYPLGFPPINPDEELTNLSQAPNNQKKPNIQMMEYHKVSGKAGHQNIHQSTNSQNMEAAWMSHQQRNG